MTDDIKSQLEREIDKTGFPLELRIADLLKNSGYEVNHSVYYVDKDEGKGREVDIVAHRSQFRKKRNARWFVIHNLAIECKKSDKPWVVFSSTARGDDDQNLFIVDVPYGTGISEWDESSWDIFDEIEKVHPMLKHERQGRNYFVPFSHSENSETIFKALTTSVKAAIAIEERLTPYSDDRLQFNYPIVVLQGKLFEAYLEDGDINIHEVDRIPINFSYISANYPQKPYLVPVVTESGFSAFLEELNNLLEYWINLTDTRPKLFMLPKKNFPPKPI